MGGTPEAPQEDPGRTLAGRSGASGGAFGAASTGRPALVSLSGERLPTGVSEGLAGAARCRVTCRSPVPRSGGCVLLLTWAAGRNPDRARRGPPWGRREEGAGAASGRQPLLVGAEGGGAVFIKVTSAHAL